MTSIGGWIPIYTCISTLNCKIERRIFINSLKMQLSILLFAFLAASSSCNTGSDVRCQVSPDVTTEIKLLKEELNALRQQMNYERTVRIELDKELAVMTKIYRQLSLEFDGIDSRFLTAAENGRNYTDDRYKQLKNQWNNNKNKYEDLMSEMKQIWELANLSSSAIRQISKNLTNFAISAPKGL